MKKYPKLLFVIVLILGLTSVTCFASIDDTTLSKVPVTRGELFTAIASWLEIEPSETSNHSFPDYDESNKLINNMVNLDYVLGTSKGTMDENEPISLDEVNYLLSRIQKPEKIITETKTRTVHSVEYIEVPVPAPSQQPQQCTEHSITILGDNILKCTVCGEVFIHSSSHNMHEDASHNVICSDCNILIPCHTHIYAYDETTGDRFCRKCSMIFDHIHVFIFNVAGDFECLKQDVCYPATTLLGELPQGSGSYHDSEGTLTNVNYFSKTVTIDNTDYLINYDCYIDDVNESDIEIFTFFQRYFTRNDIALHAEFGYYEGSNNNYIIELILSE